MILSNPPSSVADRGLHFFGEITASVSHEIKNCLAIMNESAGLLQDLVMLNRKGKPLDPEQMDRIAGQIARQISRADAVVKNLNGFAHSVDHPEKSIDLTEALSLAVALSQRLAANRGVTLELDAPEGATVMNTNPFLFQNLIRRLIDFATGSAGTEKKIVVAYRIRSGNPEIAFSKLKKDDSEEKFAAFREETAPLLEVLGGELLWGVDGTEIRLECRKQ